jgi:hypothetical protein
MNFCPGSKNSIIGKTPRKPQDMTELSTNYLNDIRDYMGVQSIFGLFLQLN